MQDLNVAMRMVDTFATVGATHFDLTHTNIDGEKRGFRPSQSTTQIKNSLPRLFPGATERQNNIIVRPLSEKVHFVQLDDLDADALKRAGEAAFLTLKTSPGNYQAWIAVSDIQDDGEARDFGRRLRRGVGADKSASGATRVAGTVNYKRDYEPEFPMVRIEDAHPGRIVTKAQLEGRGLVSAPEPDIIAATESSAESSSTRQTGLSQYLHRIKKAWPYYAISLAGAPPNRAGTGPDRSMADFTWCMTAIDWGWSIEETARKLPEVGERAHQRVEHLRDEGYPLITAQNAAAEVERNDRKRGRG